MQPKKPYYETTLISFKRSKTQRIITICFVGALIIGFIIFISISIYNLVNSGIHYKSYYYVYVTTDAQDATEAEEKANEYRVRGGAGLTAFINERWCVLLSLYLNEKDATSVANQLIGQNIQALVGSVNTAKIPTKNLNDKQYDVAENIYNHFLQTVETLYSISIDLDTAIITESSAQVRVNQLYLLWLQRTQELAKTIDITNSESADHPLLSVYSLSLKITGLLQFLVNENNYETSLLTYTSLIRKTTIELAQITL